MYSKRVSTSQSNSLIDISYEGELIDRFMYILKVFQKASLRCFSFFQALTGFKFTSCNAFLVVLWNLGPQEKDLGVCNSHH